MHKLSVHDVFLLRNATQYADPSWTCQVLSFSACRSQPPKGARRLQLVQFRFESVQLVMLQRTLLRCFYNLLLHRESLKSYSMYCKLDIVLLKQSQAHIIHKETLVIWYLLTTASQSQLQLQIINPFLPWFPRWTAVLHSIAVFAKPTCGCGSRSIEE